MALHSQRPQRPRRLRFSFFKPNCQRTGTAHQRQACRPADRFALSAATGFPTEPVTQLLIGKTKRQSRDFSGPAAGVTLIYSPPTCLSTGDFSKPADFSWTAFGPSGRRLGSAPVRTICGPSDAPSRDSRFEFGGKDAPSLREGAALTGRHRHE